MQKQELHRLIDSCIFLNDEKKDFLKRNFCVYPKQKQDRIIGVLQKTSKLSVTKDDFETFTYGMKIWSKKREIEELERKDTEIGA